MKHMNITDGQDRHNQVEHMNTTEMNGQDRHNQVKHMNTTDEWTRQTQSSDI